MEFIKKAQIVTRDTLVGLAIGFFFAFGTVLLLLLLK